MGLGRFKRKKVHVTEIGKGAEKSRIYTIRTSKYPVFVLHGLSARGYNDDRLVAFAQDLALCGFRVYTPNMIGLCSLDFQFSDIETLVADITSAGKRGAQVGIIGFSVGATYGLIAAAQERIREKIGFVLAAGGYYSFDDLLDNALKDPDSDIYARLVLAYGARDVLNIPKKQRRMFECIMMEYCLREDSFTEAEKKIIKKVGKMSTSGEVRSWWKERREQYRKLDLSGNPYLSNVKAPVFLMHATGDKLLPSEGTMKIHKELMKRGKVAGMNLNESDEHLSYVGANFIGLYKILYSIMRIQGGG